jgi:2-dehydropantoate 2-reductase
MTHKRTNKKRFLIVGLGAIGQIFACHIKASGCSVYGIDIRQDVIEAIRKNGVSLEGITTLHANLDGVYTQLGELKGSEFDYVVICVKTPYMEEVVSALKDFKNDFSIVAMQNGIDNEEFLAKYFKRDRVMRVVVNFAGNIVSPGLVKMSFFHKPNYVGCLCTEKICDRARDLAGVMTAAGLDTDACENIKMLTWRKTILVAALAPISALLGMTMIEVMKMSETNYLVQMLLEEAIEVARAKDYDFGEDFFDYCINYLTVAGNHKPSMLIDIEDGFPTEIEFINGKISYHGHDLDIPVHLNTYLTLLVKAKEQVQIKKREKE